MAPPTVGQQNVRGYVLPDGAVCALGDTTPPYQFNPYRFYVVGDYGFPNDFPVLTEILFDVAAFALDGQSYAFNVRKA